MSRHPDLAYIENAVDELGTTVYGLRKPKRSFVKLSDRRLNLDYVMVTSEGVDSDGISHLAITLMGHATEIWIADPDDIAKVTAALDARCQG